MGRTVRYEIQDCESLVDDPNAELTEQFQQFINNVVKKHKEEWEKLWSSLHKVIHSVIVGGPNPIKDYKKKNNKNKTKDEENSSENKFEDLVNGIIEMGHGDKLVDICEQIIPDIDNLRIKWETFIYLLAILSANKRVRIKALQLVPKVCHKPQRLFYYLACGEAVSKKLSWDQPFRRTIAEFYLKRERSPKNLLLMCSRYKKRYGWSHRKVLRKCHAKVQGATCVARRIKRRQNDRRIVRTQDPEWQARNLVLCYLSSGIKGVENQLKMLKEQGKDDKSATDPIKCIIDVLEKLKSLKSNEEEIDSTLVPLIKIGKKVNCILRKEHIRTEFLKSEKVIHLMTLSFVYYF